MERLKNIRVSNKEFLSVSIEEHLEIFKGDLNIDGKSYIVPAEVIEDICKSSGVTGSINKILRTTNPTAWVDTVVSLYRYYYPEGKLNFLVDDKEVLGVTFKEIRPLLNTEFFHETYSMITDYKDLLEVGYRRYDVEDVTSEILLFRKDCMEYNGKGYRVGILLTNSELGKVVCTLVIETQGILFYLPKKYCNLTSTRYNRNSSDSIEAYKLLMLRILEDMNDENWFSVIPEIDSHIVNCGRLPVTYEEYRRAVRLLSRVAVLSDMDEEEVKDIIDTFEKNFSDFERNYPALPDKKGSYIWRCSAVGDSTILRLVNALKEIIDTHSFYPEVSADIRTTIGDFIVLNKIVDELATSR